MEQGGWSFSWNDGYIFWPGDQFCGDYYSVPSTSYCGFQYPGDGEISYTFTSSGTADLRYGQSWYAGSVHVKKNEEELDSRNTIGISDIRYILVWLSARRADYSDPANSLFGRILIHDLLYTLPKIFLSKM